MTIKLSDEQIQTLAEKIWKALADRSGEEGLPEISAIKNTLPILLTDWLNWILGNPDAWFEDRGRMHELIALANLSDKSINVNTLQ